MSLGVSLLSVEGLSKSYGGIHAVRSVSFMLQAGEILALIGPNGAGKSSLLNIINGVYRADSVAVIFDGARFVRIRPGHAAHLGIGRTFQHNALFRHLSVLDNVLAGLIRHSRTSIVEHAFGLARDRRETREFTRQADETLAFLDLTRHRDTIAATLPYGVQKRVDLARALVGRPSLLLLDEPMAGMNEDEKHEMSRFIMEANRALGTTIVLIEHDMSVVMGLSHHVVVLDYGRKVGDGAPEAVRRDPDVIAAYLGTVH